MPKFYKQLQQFCSNIAFYLDFQYKKIKIIWYTELPNKLLCILNHFDDYKHIYKYNFFGLCFLILLFYNRLLIEKLPKNLELFYILLLITSIVMIISQSYVIYKTIKALLEEKQEKQSNLTRRLKINIKRKQKKYMHKDDISKIKTFIYNWNLPTRIKNTYGVLLSILKESNICLKIYYKISSLIIPKLKDKTLTIYILLFVLPKVLMCLIFFIEVVFLNQIIYFYKLLWILLIPLTTKIMLYTLKIISVLNLQELSKVVTLEIIDANDKKYNKAELGYSEDEKKYFKFDWADPKYKSLSENDLIQITLEILDNRQITFFAEDLYEKETLRYVQNINLIVTSITLSVWLYIFIQMIKYF